MESAHLTSIKAMQLQEQLERKILKFIVSSMMPMETVTNSDFLEMFKSFNVPEQDLKVFNRDILEAKLVELFYNTSEQLRADLGDALEVCFVANIWQRQEKTSCLVTMAHWIDGEMTRRSAVLKIKKLLPIECRSDILEHMLKDIKEEFNIRTSGIYCASTVTCNLLRAFSAYGVEKKSIADRFQNIDTSNEIIMKNDLLSALEPRNLSCYVQVLSNLASFEVVRVISNCEMLSNLHGRVMQKCNILWNHQKANEILEDVTGITLTRPSMVGWISLYTALGEILTIKDKSMEIFQAFKIKDYLNGTDFLYIEEHLACTKPIADAIAILEGSKHSLFGSLLPTLLALRRHLNKLLEREWTYCSSLVLAIENMVSEKFQSFYKFETDEAVEAAIAAFSHPEFKNRWLPCVDLNFQLNMLQAFKAAVQEELLKTRPLDTKKGILNVQSRSDLFFDFGSENEVIEPMSSVVDMQVLNYFNYTSRSLDSLIHFPEIYKVFMKYNSPLSSFWSVKPMPEYICQHVLTSDKVLVKNIELKIWLKANEHLL